MYLQQITSITSTLNSLWRTNPNRSLSGLFKYFRKQQKLNLIGDYPILAFIISYSYCMNPSRQWNRSQVLRAVRCSGFYREEGKKDAYIPVEWKKYLKK